MEHDNQGGWQVVGGFVAKCAIVLFQLLSGSTWIVLTVLSYGLTFFSALWIIAYVWYWLTYEPPDVADVSREFSESHRRHREIEFQEIATAGAPTVGTW